MTMTNLSSLGVNENTPIEDVRKILNDFFNSNQENTLLWDVSLKLKNNDKIIIESLNNISIEFKSGVVIEHLKQNNNNSDPEENNLTVLHLRGKKIGEVKSVKLKDIKNKDFFFPITKNLFDLITKKYNNVNNFIIYSTSCFFVLTKNAFNPENVRKQESVNWVQIDDFYCDKNETDEIEENFYIYTSPKISIKNLAMTTSPKDQLDKYKSKTGLRVDFGNHVKIENCQIYGFKYSGITCLYCYRPVISECLVNGIEDIGADLMAYGINVASSYNSVVIDCCALNCKHGLSVGGKTPSYNTLIKNCVLTQIQSYPYAVLRTHDTAIKTTISDCLFNGPIDHCGVDIQIQNCQFMSPTMTANPAISIKSQNKNAGSVIIENVKIANYWTAPAIYIGDGYTEKMGNSGVVYDKIKIKLSSVASATSFECLRVIPQYGDIAINEFSLEDVLFNATTAHTIVIRETEQRKINIKNLNISGIFSKKSVGKPEDFLVSSIESYDNKGLWISGGKVTSKPEVKLKTKN